MCECFSCVYFNPDYLTFLGAGGLMCISVYLSALNKLKVFDSCKCPHMIVARRLSGKDCKKCVKICGILEMICATNTETL